MSSWRESIGFPVEKTSLTALWALVQPSADARAVGDVLPVHGPAASTGRRCWRLGKCEGACGELLGEAFDFSLYVWEIAISVDE